MSRKSDFVSTYRQGATTVLNALLAMKSLHEEARIMNYPGAIAPEDIAGANADITKPFFVGGKTAMDTILTLLTDDVLRDLYKIRL